LFSRTHVSLTVNKSFSQLNSMHLEISRSCWYT